MLREVGYVEPPTHKNISISERIFVAAEGRVEPFIDIQVDVPLQKFQTQVAFAARPRVDRSFNMKEAVDVAQLQMHVCGRRKLDSLKRLNGHLVVDEQNLPAAGDEAADIDFVRSTHACARRRMKAPHDGGASTNDLEHCRAHARPCQTDSRAGLAQAMDITTSLARAGVTFAPEIAQAARQNRLDPALLAAVAAQETGGPGSNGGANIVGDGGHGRGLFQIDDRWHAFAASAAALNPAKNADYAAGMLSGLLRRYGGDVHKALSAYNSGSPAATGTTTRWRDGETLGYADSVLRHYENIAHPSDVESARADIACAQANVNAPLHLLGRLLPQSVCASPPQHIAWSAIEGLDATGHSRGELDSTEQSDDD